MNIKIEVARISLEKLFNPTGHFNISLFKEIMDILDVIVPAEDLKILHPLHCVDWSAMKPEVRQWVADLVDDLCSNPIHLSHNFKPKVLRIETALSNNFKFLLGEK